MRLSTERERYPKRRRSRRRGAPCRVRCRHHAPRHRRRVLPRTPDAGHNERLIARAISTWSGNRSHIRVATKGGLTRPQGGWVPDGRARHLTAACEASRRALGVERIHLYQLHVPDPRVAARNQRAGTRRAEARRAHRVDRPVQRERGTDRRGQAHHRDRDGPGRAQRLERRQPPERRLRVLHVARDRAVGAIAHSAAAAAARTWCRSAVLNRDRGQARGDRVRDRCSPGCTALSPSVVPSREPHASTPSGRSPRAATSHSTPRNGAPRRTLSGRPCDAPCGRRSPPRRVAQPATARSC